MKFIIFSLFFFILISCNVKDKQDTTNSKDIQLQKTESAYYLDDDKPFTLFSLFQSNGVDYFAYLRNSKIYITNLANAKDKDSLNIIFDNKQTDKYGSISSFCFYGKDSVFLLLTDAIFLVVNKHLSKTIPINDMDTVQFNRIRFDNLEDAPIYYNKQTNEIIGQVYCSECGMANSSFYKQNTVGKISLRTNKFETFNISYPQNYIDHYYGFAMHVYINSYDTFSLISFPCNTNIFLLNRYKNSVETYTAKSKYQTEEAMPLDTSSKNSTEEKMRHLATVPYYAEILYDKYRGLYYRFFRENIPLKQPNGKYNDFTNKPTVLMVLNKQFVVIGEYELTDLKNSYYSFVGKAGLYVKESKSDRKGATKFRIFNFVQ